MSDEQPLSRTLLEAMRAEFDKEFAAPIVRDAVIWEDLLEIRVGGTPYLLPLREFARVAACPAIVPIPSSAPELLGISGILGRVTPIYSLALLLGYGKTDSSHRWVILVGSEDPFGLAIGELSGYIKLPRNELLRSEPLEQGLERQRTALAGIGPEGRTLLELSTVTTHIKRRAAQLERPGSDR